MIALCVAVEFLNGSIPYPPRPVLTTAAGRWLASQPGGGAVICLPLRFDQENTPCMLQSLEHGRPIVNGYSGLRPPFFPAVVDAMSRMPSPEGVLTLHDLNVQFVVSDRPLDVPPALAAFIADRGKFDDQTVYEMTWSPDATASLTPDTGPPPPPPGPFRFKVGEAATYRVHWTSGPMNVPAGEMAIAVAQPKADEAFRFVATAKTAPWVARFFAAVATLETTADPRLLPIAHAETIDDGKRTIERQLEFDFDRHSVRMTTGGTPITLPLAPEARDPMTALFYVRTLPLADGATFSVPLTDNGRSARLDVTVVGQETVAVDGRPLRAWKVVPAIRQRIERGQPLALTTWVSADDRQIPLIVDLTAVFGRVRAELVNYRQQ